MRRRTFVQGVLSILSSSALPISASAQSTPSIAVAPRRFIDAHCHFFNAADLPVKGFVQKVALGDFSKAPEQIAQRADAFSVWKGLVAWLADWIIRGNAPKPATEISCLTNATACPGFAQPKTRFFSKSLTTDQPEISGEDKDRLRDLFMQEFQKQDQKGFARSLQTEEEQDRQAFLDFVLDEMRAAGESAPGVSMRTLQENKSARFVAMDRVAAFIFGSSVVSRYFSWARLLISYRSDIIQTYNSQYDPDQNRAILTTPALVDFSYWLGDYSAAPLMDQIELMAQLSLRQKTPMHGFVPFDPLHQIRSKPDETSPLELVKQAIGKHGFIGVKLYPPMGYRPAQNNDQILDFSDYAEPGENVGEKLDLAFKDLFDWCALEQVPILAHTADSQEAGDGFGERGDPKYWEFVLADHPELRLNFAHFSGFDKALKGPGAPDVSKFADCWEYRIGQLAANPRFPNIYSDISYFFWVLGNGGGDRPTFDAMKTLLAEYFQTFDPEAKTILFGTDWSMIAQERDFQTYIDKVENFFRDIGLDDAQLDNIFFRNSLRFLGLEGQTKTIERLTAFYSANERPMPIFQ